MAICVHCGEECGKYPIVWNNLNFCCNGCKTVYQLLNENKLYSYYKIEETPGIKVENANFGSKYAYLDSDEVKEKMYEFSQDDIKKITLYIPSIHCSSCIWLLENLHQLNKGIKQSLTNFVKKEVSITFNETEITLRQIVELLASIHYIPFINLAKVSQEENKQNNRLLYMKIGVAGFAFGNTMMLSFPEYMPGSDFISDTFRSTFGYLNFAFALPVILFSGTDYLFSAFKNLKRGILNIDLPISIGMLAIFFQSTYEIFSGAGAGYMDSLCGFVFFLLIGRWYQNKTYQALSFERDYKSYFPIAATKLTNGQEESVLIETLKKDDTILIRNQELIPADGILTKGTAYIDYSFVTGEANPVKKELEAELYAGGRQIGAAIEVKILSEVKQSKLTKLWEQNENKTTKSNKLSQLTDKVSRNFTYLVLSVAFLTGLYWLLADSSLALKAFTSVLIVACPCALALSIPFTFGNTMHIFGKLGFYLKNSDVIESLAKINTFVFDKTGTITQSDTVNVHFEGKELTNEQKLVIKSLTRHSTHPISATVYKSIEVDNFVEIDNFRELPARGVIGEYNKKSIKLGSYEFIFNKQTDEEFSNRAYLSIDGEFYGYFSIENKYRQGLDEVLNALHKNGEIYLISGDNDSEKERLLPLFGKPENMLFHQLPNDKLEFVKSLKAQNKQVLMVGDGLNDAGALNESTLGISIADNIYHFSPACDAILEAKQFDKLMRFILFSKTAVKIVYFSYALSIIYNIAGLYFAVRGMLSPIIAAILMPASSVSVVAFVSLSVLLLSRRLSK